ncbi:glycosyltransferase family 2 protein [Candidatus Woesebacteria bacterium]|nr:glycosyltransferase family 2 protein [Candidatus Woesebacteria bacterium]
MPSASIILVTYNSSDFIGECLSSLQKLTGIGDAEIIVWDNASTDSTVKLIEKKFPKVTLHTSEKNLGFGAAVNKAANLAKGKYIILLNPDTQVSKNWLEPLLATFKLYKNVGAVNSKTKIVIDGKEYIQNAGNYVFYDAHSRDRGAVITKDRQQLYEEDSQYYNTPTEVDAFSGVSVAIDRKLFLELGGFDEHMFMYYEDTDFSLRLKKAGYSIWYQPKSELKHIHSASSEEWSEFFVYHTELNRLLFLWKHFSFARVIIEMGKYKASMFKQLLKLKRRGFTRFKVLLKLGINLPYLTLYRLRGDK